LKPGLRRSEIRPGNARRLGAVFGNVKKRADPGKIFLLSPASLNGERAKLLLPPTARSETARKIRSPEGAPLEEVFTFVSSLYFRGKLAYARHFAVPPAGFPREGSVLVIAPGIGLVPPDWRIDRERAEILRGTPVDLKCPGYVEPMRQHVRALHDNIPASTPVVLLGSIATGKYVDLLEPVFGERLFFPGIFAGAGDMRRGSLLLRAVREEKELDYVTLAAPRHGRRSRSPA
jgi:hypothetical protein